MVEMIYLIMGFLVIVLIFLDILFTTFSMEGGGKMTDFFLGKLWKTFLWLNGFNGKKKWLNYAGIIMMISLIFIWGIGLWFGVFFIFASNPDSIIHSGSHYSTGLLEKFYFSGYVLSTMGLGDYQPSNGKWGVVSSFFSFFGLVFITLMVSYVLPVLSKIIEKKQFSLYIHHWGGTPHELLLYFWNGKDFSNLKDVSRELQQSILIIGKSHQAYPILHYFHSNLKEESLVITFCLIDEALTILLHDVAPGQWDEKEILPLRKAISTYLETMKKIYQYKGKDAMNVPRPEFSVLSKAKIKLLESQCGESQRRNLWSEILQSKGWTWKEVYPEL